MAAIPPPAVNLLPLGLLDALGIKSGGLNPRALGEVLDPSLDLWPWYASVERETLIGTLNVAAVGTGSVASAVPNGEIWRVSAISVISPTLGAGVSIGLTWALFNQAGSTMMVGDSPVRATVGEQAISGGRIDYCMRGGETFGIACSNITAGPVNGVSVRITFNRSLA